MKRLSVLYEDNHLLVVDKPSGCPTMGTAGDQETIAKLAGQYIKQKYQKPGNVFIGVVSRLDSLVSGVLVLARTSKAASRLSEQLREHSTNKFYLAWTEEIVADESIRHRDASGWIYLRDWIAKDERAQRMVITRSQETDSQLAEMYVRSIDVKPPRQLVQISLKTGRKHQIRAQLAERRSPILGDRKYGARSTFPTGIALHCHRIEIVHPTRGDAMVFSTPPPAYWPRVSQELAARAQFDPPVDVPE